MITEKRKYDTVLFDFDGTIMDTNNLIIDSLQHVCTRIDGHGRPVPELLATFGEPLADTMEKFFPEVPVEKSLKIYRSFHYDNFSKLINIFPGIRELLEELKDRDYKTGIVTSRLARTTLKGLDKFNIRDKFDVIITVEECPKAKPDPMPVEMALKRLGSRADKTIMLGDTKYDIQCANNAGVTSVLVSWAMASSGEELEGSKGPDYVLDKPEDMFKILR